MFKLGEWVGSGCSQSESQVSVLVLVFWGLGPRCRGFGGLANCLQASTTIDLHNAPVHEVTPLLGALVCILGVLETLLLADQAQIGWHGVGPSPVRLLSF
jgi:hypothetical protein